MNYIRTTMSTLALIAFSTTVAPAQMKPPIPLTAQQFSDAPAGQSVTLAVRVRSLKRTDLRAELLERGSDGVYKATGKLVTLYYPDGTPIVMGGASDVMPGAILFVYGVATKKDQADVKRLLVVTNYVKVR